MSAPPIAAREELAKALGEHRVSAFRETSGKGWWRDCSCGKRIEDGREGNHLADALLASDAIQTPAEFAAGLQRPLFTAVVKASETDWTGHLPNCGYTHEHQVCGCADWGRRVYEAIVAALAERTDA